MEEYLCRRSPLVHLHLQFVGRCCSSLLRIDCKFEKKLLLLSFLKSSEDGKGRSCDEGDQVRTLHRGDNQAFGLRHTRSYH